MDYREEAIECVKDCVLPIHQQIYAKYGGDFDRIYSEGYNSKSYQGRVIEPGKVYELSYQECSCPKVKCGLRSNPEQCECSRQSILFILSQLEPDSRFDVRIENTILRGGERCTFRITRHAGMDIKHHFIEKGQGEPLILLHGNGENCDYFTGQVDAFAQYYHVYALDTRGHGKTPRGNAPFTIRRFAEDLLGFMDANGIEKAHILGFSDGGNIAMIFAMKYPERVSRLILNGANLDAKGIKRSVQCPIEMGYWFAKLFENKSDEAKLHAEMLGLMVHDPNVKPEELLMIQAKTLVIAGTKDMVKDEHTRLIASHIPDAQLVILDGDHFVANRCPDAFNRAVLNFLRNE